MIEPVTHDNFARYATLVGRGLEIVLTRNSISATTQDSWGSLVNSKTHKKRLQLVKKMDNHFDWWIRKKVPNIKDWSIELRGSNSKIDVQHKRKQKIRINFTVNQGGNVE